MMSSITWVPAGIFAIQPSFAMSAQGTGALNRTTKGPPPDSPGSSGLPIQRPDITGLMATLPYMPGMALAPAAGPVSGAPASPAGPPPPLPPAPAPPAPGGLPPVPGAPPLPVPDEPLVPPALEPPVLLEPPVPLEPPAAD